MFDKEDRIKKEQEELLEIFLLVEENTMRAKVEALRRYAKLYEIKDMLKANELMKKTYSDFNK